MIETRVRDIRKMLPDGWAAEVAEDGAIVVTAPENLVGHANAEDIVAAFVSAIEQPLTLTYTLTTGSAAVLAAATAAAARMGWTLVEIAEDKYQVIMASDSLPKASKPAARKRQPKVRDEGIPTSAPADSEPDDTGVTG